jgi:hypothetical protein
MAENVPQTVEFPVPLSLFGGLVTEMNPSNLPEGISPDNQDVVYLPGGVSSRPGMRRWLSGLTAGTTVTYSKTFVNPQGISLNLILTSDGSFWVQDTSVAPYLPTLLGNVTPGSYCSSVTAFGKELIAFHNGVDGTDIPRTYDGQYFDRATQCGPGAPPSVANTPIPASILASVAPVPVSITSVTPGSIITIGSTDYDTRLVIITSVAHGYSTDQLITLSGTTEASYNGYSAGITFIDDFTFSMPFLQISPGPVATGGSSTVSISFLSRAGNTVSANTSTDHGLQVGYQVQISGVADAQVGSGISSIIIDNEENPGIATITMAAKHGLLPQNQITITGVPNSAVGGAIVTAVRSGQVTTIETTTDHGISAGSTVSVAGVTDTSFNGQFIVLSVPTSTTFTYSQVDVDATSTSGTVGLSWLPTGFGLVENLFTVVSVPSPLTFQVQISYSDGTWVGGAVSFSWNGIFYVTGVFSATSFQYQQYGPNASSPSGGTVTPYCQIAPGARQCVVLFQTRTGFITAPSPTVSFIANGGQYLTITNIPIGPSNVVRRILAFTGANGANFFYIPVPAFVNGLTVSTSTQIEDNVTTSILLDFSDNTLFDSIAIDIPGFNLFESRVLGPCLSVSSYASRSKWWGMKNIVPNFLNLGFEGGYLSGNLNIPLGWTNNPLNNSGTLDTANAVFGMDWLITGSGGGLFASDGYIHQPAYSDYNGIPILNPLTSYSVRLRLSRPSSAGGTGGNVTLRPCWTNR